MLKIATAAYPLDWLSGWTEYEDKLSRWVSEAAGHGARLLIFPEYGAMELATLDGEDVAADLAKSLRAVSDRLPAADSLHQRLAVAHGVHILAASGPCLQAGQPVNRARLFAPGGDIGVQDKQIMTRFERETWGVGPGRPLQVFETDLGRIGVLICYDAEFPLLGRALEQAHIILVPSCTDALSGYSRVRIGAMARALEAQCVTVVSSVVGQTDWSEAVDVNVGRGGIYGPPDLGFPPDGVLAEGAMDVPGWTYADVDLDAIATVRRDGQVLNHAHWEEQISRADSVSVARLR